MKPRENLAMKALAFIAAVAAFTATAIMGWYQLMNYDALWNDTNAYDSLGYTSYYWLMQDKGHVNYLIGLYERRDAGEELTLLERRDMDQLEERFSPRNTNLRWQLLRKDGSVIYGNTTEDSSNVTSDYYWFDYTLGLINQPEINIGWEYINESGNTFRETVNGDEYGGYSFNDLWRSRLPEMAALARDIASESGTELAQRLEEVGFGDGMGVKLNTILADDDGYTAVMRVTDGNERYVYLPTIQACLEANAFGYIFDADSVSWKWAGVDVGPEKETVSLALWVDKGFPVDDMYRAANLKLTHWQADREWYLAGTIILGTAGILLMVYLCCATGHKRGVEGIYLNWFHRLPGDVALSVMLLLGAVSVASGVELTMDAYMDAPMAIQLICIGTAVAVTAALCLGALLTVCARCKAHTLLRNTWTWAMCAWCWRRVCQLVGAAGKTAQAIPLIWKAVMGCMAYTLFTITTFEGSAGLWLLVTALVSIYLCRWAYQWKRIRHGTQEIIGGNPNYHIETRHMLPDLRGHADELNNLGHAISTAVDERMKSERFKAELITNVSHDLKTPLTSIINYVDLLKKVEISDPKAQGYIEVLDRKSQRLKKLTEDLVEASKASTGNLTVNWERLDFKQLTDQALAECGDRLEAQGLTVVRTLPEEPMWVDADGRHLWRVLDNLLGNCAKYALPGTRVYVELREKGGWAVLSVKNISRDALDMPAERLMERFVRGDESRNASGSGLGLSIAQSLTELQHGRFEISIDGDLFKAIVTLPLAGEDGAGLPVLRL